MKKKILVDITDSKTHTSRLFITDPVFVKIIRDYINVRKFDRFFVQVRGGIA